MPTTTASSSSKAPSSIGALVLVKSSKPKIGQPSVRPDPPALQYPCDTLTGCENASCRWRLRRQDLGHAAPCFSVLLEVSGRFEEILLGYALKLSYPGSGASAKDTIFGAFEESGNDTSNDGSSFPSHGDGELRRQLASLENQLASKNISVSTVSVTKRPSSRKKIPLSSRRMTSCASVCRPLALDRSAVRMISVLVPILVGAPNALALVSRPLVAT